jgi:imidazolonepropionase-like amidohydrolase
MLGKLASKFLLIVLFGLSALAQSATPTLVITDVNVVPMDTERILERQTVLIRNGRIVAIGPSVAIPRDARRIDGSGKFLMPGLIDAHVHLMSPDDLISYLAYGVTTVVNMSGTPADLRLRREVRKGTLLGPNIYTAGPTIDGYPPLNEVFVTAESPEQGAALVVDHKRAGYDFIKVYGTLRPNVFSAIADACRREHMTLTGHINRQMPTTEVFSAGQVLAAHAEDLIFARFDHPPSGEELTTLADEVSKAGITVTANLALNPATAAQVQNLDEVLSSDEARYLSAATYSRWIQTNNRNVDEDPNQHLENIRQAQAIDLQFVRLLHDRKVPIILGTDASAYGFPGQSVWDELKQTEAAGLSRFEALATATRNSGGYLAGHIDRTHNIGTVDEGTVADLLLLNTNPLTTDLTRKDIAGLILRGRWISKGQIDQARAELKRRLATEHNHVEVADKSLVSGDVQAARKKFTNRHAPLLDEWVLLTKARQHENNLQLSVQIARLYVGQFPDTFSAHQLLADLLQKAGNNAASRAEARIALAQQPHCATAANILKRASFSDAPPNFSGGDYGLQIGHGSQLSAAVLHLENHGKSWVGTLKMDESSSPLRAISLGNDQLWFKAGQDFQEKEIRLSISKTGEVRGLWWSMFGRNGTVTGKKVQ